MRRPAFANFHNPCWNVLKEINNFKLKVMRLQDYKQIKVYSQARLLVVTNSNKKTGRKLNGLLGTSAFS